MGAPPIDTVSTRSISLVGIVFRSTCPPPPADEKTVEALAPTKRRPLTSVSVRCEPRPYRLTKLWPTPNPLPWLPSDELSGTAKPGS